MSDEDSMSEGFSASEDEWKPSKNVKDGESSDDDDSEFEESPLLGSASGGSGTSASRKRGEPKARSAAKQSSSKKRTGLSLRTKLFNKYRPPPKTFSPPNSLVGKNSPTASTSRTNSKNSKTPNESKLTRRKVREDSGSSSDSSINNYLVNPEDLDIQSSFFNVESKTIKNSSLSPPPLFDCNAGLENLDSVSDDEEVGNKNDENAFDFNNLLEYAKSLERIKKCVAKHNTDESKKKSFATSNVDSLDVYAVLALGEKQKDRSHNDGEDEDDEDDDEGLSKERCSAKNRPSKLSKTKSTRVKRHTKTRPTSIVAANDTDDSEWEEVADSLECIDKTAASNHTSQIGNLEIHVELPSRKREKKKTTAEDIEIAFKRRLNRDLKERQVLLHKASLLCRFGRNFFYNRLLNDTILMQNTLKLLPSKSAYPPDRGTEIKYFQSMVTWFKSAVKLNSQNLYPEKTAAKTKSRARIELLKQIEKKEARSKQDMIFILIILLRGMGLQCRLIVNIQPVPLKPAQSDLLTIKMKKDEKNKEEHTSLPPKSFKKKVVDSDNQTASTSSKKATKPKNYEKEMSKKDTVKTHKNKKYKDEKPLKSNKSSDKSVAKNQSLTNSHQANQDECKEEEDLKSDYKRKNLSGMENFENNRNNILKQTKSHVKDINSTSNDKKAQSKLSTPPTSSVELSILEKEEKKKCEHISESSELEIKGSDNNNKTESARSSKLKIKKLDNVKNNKSETGSGRISIISESKDFGETLEYSQKENEGNTFDEPSLACLKQTKSGDNNQELNRKKPVIGSIIIPKVVIHSGKDQNSSEESAISRPTRCTRSRSKSPQAHISAAFLLQSTQYKNKFPGIIEQNSNVKNKTAHGKSRTNKVKISTDFLTNTEPTNDKKRVLRSRQKINEAQSKGTGASHIQIPQLDGAGSDDNVDCNNYALKPKGSKSKLNLKKLKKLEHGTENSDEDFEPSPPKKQKTAPALKKRNRQVVSSDDESDKVDNKRKPSAGDMWLEVWSDVEEQWVCIDIFKGKIHCIDTIRNAASNPLAYVFAFQNDLSIKDVTARYSPNWATVLRKCRVDKTWLDAALSKYLSHRTKRDIEEDHELRRIHEEKPMPTTISDYKNHPFYALERHLLKFEAIYPSEAPALGYIRGESVYSRDCVHTLHSREIWLKQARTVKLGEKPYKIVKARPKWDRITQTVIKDQPLEIFGFWQTQDYEPPTAENGLVPRNAYGNVELFKPSMLPKKTKHIRLPGLNRICKKLSIDCANAVVGFDFHQGACHPTYDGFIVCEEFEDQVIKAWHQDQEEQERKEQGKYEARVYGNWKKLIRGLLIREHLKLKYKF